MSSQVAHRMVARVPHPRRETASTPQATSSMTEEREWVERAAAGDRAAFRWLFDRYREQVVCHVGRMLGRGPDVDDVVQEVFVQVYRSLDSYRGDSKFSTWLFRLTHNVTCSHLRKRKKPIDLDAIRWLSAVTTEGRRHEAREELRMLYAAMDDLNEDARTAFVLYELEGLTLREISEMLDTSINTIAARVRRSREQLAEAIEKAHEHIARGRGGAR